MTTSESKGRFFLQNESIRIANWNAVLPRQATPQTLLVASICGPPAAISCSYRDTGVPCSVVGPLLWPARRPATRYQTTSEIRHVRCDPKIFLFSFY